MRILDLVEDIRLFCTAQMRRLFLVNNFHIVEGYRKTLARQRSKFVDKQRKGDLPFVNWVTQSTNDTEHIHVFYKLRFVFQALKYTHKVHLFFSSVYAVRMLFINRQHVVKTGEVRVNLDFSQRVHFFRMKTPHKSMDFS